MVHKLVFLVACSAAVGCATVTTARTGDPIALPSGAPSTPCEQSRALEVAPTKVFAQGADDAGIHDGYYVTIVREQEAEGLGIYRTDNRQLVELPHILPELGNQDLERRHMGRVQPINDKRDRQVNWFLFSVTGGLGLLTAGIAVAAIGIEQEDSSTVGLIGVAVMGVGIVSTLVGLVAALANHPTGQERIYSDVRNRIFLDGEDDLVEVVKSIDAFNVRVRGACASGDD